MRFVTYLNTRSQATEQATANAIASVQQGLSFVIQENLTAAGVSLPGFFNVIVDDGSGNPPASLLSTIYEAIDQVRPIGASFSVNPPKLLIANVVITLTVADASLFNQAQVAVNGAIVTYIDALPVGQALRYSRIAGLAYDAASNVVNVVSLTLNGGLIDLGGQPGSVVRAGSVTAVAG